MEWRRIWDPGPASEDRAQRSIGDVCRGSELGGVSGVCHAVLVCLAALYSRAGLSMRAVWGHRGASRAKKGNKISKQPSRQERKDMLEH